MRKNVDDIDSIMESVNQWEQRRQHTTQTNSSNKEQVGTVEKFYPKLNVAAIKLTGQLSVGDIIEIGTEEEAIRQKVSSMQIDREEVFEASDGDDVGVALKYVVTEGSCVYKIT